MCLTFCFCVFVLFLYCTVELHLSGLIGTVNHPDMQKISITGFFFENRLHGQFELEKKISTNGCFRSHTYFHTNEHSCEIPYMCLTVGGKMCIKRCSMVQLQ